MSIIGNKTSAAGEKVKEAIEIFTPKNGSKPPSKAGIARYLVNKYPLLFDSVEAARMLVRYYTGAQGEGNRKGIKSKEYFYNLVDIPESHTEPYLPHIIDIKKYDKILNLSDVHVPYHSPMSLDLAINYGIQHGAKLCLLNGDFMDMYQVSDYVKDPSRSDLAVERMVAVELLGVLRKTFKHILFKTGNHEERWERKLLQNPAMFGIEEFNLRNLLKLSEDEYVTDQRIIKAGKLNIIHGHELRAGISSPVSFGKKLYDSLGEHAIAGHNHQTSEYSFTRPISGDLITCWSQGHLGDEHPNYQRLSNRWNHGFSFVEVDSDGTFELHNKRISRGRVF